MNPHLITADDINFGRCHARTKTTGTSRDRFTDVCDCNIVNASVDLHPVYFHRLRNWEAAHDSHANDEEETHLV